MNLEKLLLQKKSAILNQWLDRILETYPDDTRRFLRKQKDQFANPVGATISKEIEHIYEEILHGVDPERISPFLDRIIRIRAVQGFSSSQAVSFVFLLKEVVREELKKEIRENQVHDGLLIFESRIDDVALLAFDIYVKCREKIYEIRANEEKNRVRRLLQKTGMTCDIPEWDPITKKGNRA